MGLYEDLSSNYPWLADLGISPAWLQETAAESASPAEVLARIRETPGYRARFSGNKRQDGSLRMTEAQYIQTENAYRSVLREFGFDVDRDYANPKALVGWFESEVSADELKTRLQVYDRIKSGSQAQRDAFYIYSGRDITVDELYEAAVDPAAEQRLYGEYNNAVAQSSLNYGEWITRATQVGLSRVAESLKASQKQGAVTAQAVQRVLNTDPNFARQMMDAIYTGGDPGGGQGTLALNQLLDAFEFAAIGAAAQNSGLDLPDRARLAEIRAAGVERQTAIDAYTKFGATGDRYNAAVQRARGSQFGQREFESAQFLHEEDAVSAFEAGAQYMESAGKSQGSFRFDEDRQGRFVQKGLSAR